jgi:hypothetical protein
MRRLLAAAAILVALFLAALVGRWTQTTQTVTRTVTVHVEDRDSDPGDARPTEKP